MRTMMLLALSLCCVSLFAEELPKPTGETIVSADAKLELLFTRTAEISGGLTEGPAVARDGSIYFSDIPLGEDKGMILRFDPRTMKSSVFATDSRKDDVKFGLLFSCGFASATSNGSDCDGRGGSNAKLVFHRLHELGYFEHAHPGDSLENLILSNCCHIIFSLLVYSVAIAGISRTED